MFRGIWVYTQAQTKFKSDTVYPFAGSVLLPVMPLTVDEGQRTQSRSYDYV